MRYGWSLHLGHDSSARLHGSCSLSFSLDQSQVLAFLDLNSFLGVLDELGLLGHRSSDLLSKLSLHLRCYMSLTCHLRHGTSLDLRQLLRFHCTSCNMSRFVKNLSKGVLVLLFDLFDMLAKVGDSLVVLLGSLPQVLHLVSIVNRLHCSLEGH